MILISENQILSMHHRLIELYGGQDGLRDESMLESALSVPFQSFQGQDFYPGITAKAARLCYGLVMNHPFLDGNKRIGAHAMLVLLELNGISLDYKDGDLIDLIFSVAKGEKDDKSIQVWLLSHLK